MRVMQEKNKSVTSMTGNRRPAFQTYFEYKTKFAKPNPLPPVPKNHYKPRTRSTSKTSSSSSCPVRPARREISCVSSGDHRSISKDRVRKPNLCAELKSKNQKEEQVERDDTEDKIIADMIENMLNRAALSLSGIQQCQLDDKVSEDNEITKGNHDHEVSHENVEPQPKPDKKVSLYDIDMVASYPAKSHPDSKPVMRKSRSAFKELNQNDSSIAVGSSNGEVESFSSSSTGAKNHQIAAKRSKECAKITSRKPSTAKESKMAKNENAMKNKSSTKSPAPVQTVAKKKTVAGPPRCYSIYMEKMKEKASATLPTDEKSATKPSRPFSNSRPDKNCTKSQFRTSQSADFSHQTKRPFSCGRLSTTEVRSATSSTPSRLGRDRRPGGQAGDGRTLSSPAGCRSATSANRVSTPVSNTGLVRRETIPTVSLAQTNVANVVEGASNDHKENLMNNAQPSSDESLLIKACPIRAEISLGYKEEKEVQQDKSSELNEFKTEDETIEIYQLSKAIRSHHELAQQAKSSIRRGNLKKDHKTPSAGGNKYTDPRGIEVNTGSPMPKSSEILKAECSGSAQEIAQVPESGDEGKSSKSTDACRKSRVPVGIRMRQDKRKVSKLPRYQRGLVSSNKNRTPVASSAPNSSNQTVKCPRPGKPAEKSGKCTESGNTEDGQGRLNSPDVKLSSTSLDSSCSSTSSTEYTLKSNFLGSCKLESTRCKPANLRPSPVEDKNKEESSISKFIFDSCAGKMVVRKSEEHESELVKIITASEITCCVPLSESDIRRRITRQDEIPLQIEAQEEDRKDGDIRENISDTDSFTELETKLKSCDSGRLSSISPVSVINAFSPEDGTDITRDMLDDISSIPVEECFCDLVKLNLKDESAKKSQRSVDAWGLGKEEYYQDAKHPGITNEGESRNKTGNDDLIVCNEDVTYFIQDESELILQNSADRIDTSKDDSVEDEYQHIDRSKYYKDQANEGDNQYESNLYNNIEDKLANLNKMESINLNYDRSSKDEKNEELSELDESVASHKTSDNCGEDEAEFDSPRKDFATNYPQKVWRHELEEAGAITMWTIDDEKNDHIEKNDCLFNTGESSIPTSSYLTEVKCPSMSTEEMKIVESNKSGETKEMKSNLRSPSPVKTPRRSLSNHSTRSNQSPSRQMESETIMSARTVAEDRRIRSRPGRRVGSQIPTARLRLRSDFVEKPAQGLVSSSSSTLKQNKMAQPEAKLRTLPQSHLPTYRRTAERTVSPVKGPGNKDQEKGLAAEAKAVGSLIPTSCRLKPPQRGLKCPIGASGKGSTGQVEKGLKEAVAQPATKTN